jgi:GxxExxY protein
MNIETELLFKDEVYTIIGACFEVYKDKGHGFLESVYQECLEMEMTRKGVPFESQVPLQLDYRGTMLKQKYVADFLCYEKIIVELKAAKSLTDEHRAQLINYLRATGMKLGLLVNFGHYPKIQWERMILSH